jgi:hypothetical protein
MKNKKLSIQQVIKKLNDLLDCNEILKGDYMTKKEHITIHLKDAIKQLRFDTPDLEQVKFDLFEIADILKIKATLNMLDV